VNTIERLVATLANRDQNHVHADFDFDLVFIGLPGDVTYDWDSLCDIADAAGFHTIRMLPPWCDEERILEFPRCDIAVLLEHSKSPAAFREHKERAHMLSTVSMVVYVDDFLSAIEKYHLDGWDAATHNPNRMWYSRTTDKNDERTTT